MTRNNQKFFLVVKSTDANDDPEKTTLGHVDVTMALLSYERHTYTHACVHMCIWYEEKDRQWWRCPIMWQ